MWADRNLTFISSLKYFVDQRTNDPLIFEWLLTTQSRHPNKKLPEGGFGVSYWLGAESNQGRGWSYSVGAISAPDGLL